MSEIKRLKQSLGVRQMRKNERNREREKEKERKRDPNKVMKAENKNEGKWRKIFIEVCLREGEREKT